MLVVGKVLSDFEWEVEDGANWGIDLSDYNTEVQNLDEQN